MQPPHSDLGDLFWRQVDPGEGETQERVRILLERRLHGEWPSPGLLHKGRSVNWAQSGVGNVKKIKLCCGQRIKPEGVLPTIQSLRPLAQLPSPPSPANAYSPAAIPQHECSLGNTHVTGLKGRLLRSDCDCSMLIDWFKASSWKERFGYVTKSPSPSHHLFPSLRTCQLSAQPLLQLSTTKVQHQAWVPFLSKHGCLPWQGGG